MTTLLLNGRIHSPTHPDATALAVRDDTVAWLGSDDVGRHQFPEADVVDLAGAFVAPAFVDSHVHVTSTGLLLSGLDLRAATSRDHLLRLLREHAGRHPDGIIWGHGWDDATWETPGAPTTAELDAAVGARPAYLSRIDVHSALASTALRRCAADLGAADGYHPDGPLSAEAHHLVRAEARAMLSDTQRAQARTTALDAFAAHGVVAVHECAGPQIGGL
ncbi:MAG: Amidohydrolase 3, partial [Mycobacterium sp.]|nr:Amidohydrolase 3 [Mycobacterium sp.]